MKKLLLAFFSLASILPCSAQDEVITNPPAGNEVEVYADFRSEEYVFDFVWDYHSVQKIVYAADGKVYIPNVLLRNTMPGYVVGTLDETAKTVTVEAGQPVYKFPNIDTVVRLYMLNGSASAGNTATNTFNSEPLVFDVADNGILTLRASEAYPMFGVVDESSVDVSYGIGADLKFTPVDLSANSMRYYSMTYINDSDDEEYTATITGYADGNDVWFKGFNPRYPNAWMKATWVDDQLRAASFQLLNMTKTEIPTVMAAGKREMNDNFEYEYGYSTAFVIDCDKQADTYSAFTEAGWFLCNLTSYDEETAEPYQMYRNIHISPIKVDPAVPENPVFDGFDSEATSKETELKFHFYAKDTEGENLLKDAIAFRYYVNGEPYTFKNSVYTSLPYDMETVPYTYQDGSTFLASGDGTKFYTYFLNSELPADLKTIGVEAIYTIDGVTNTSEVLVYNVKTGKTEYATSGIADINADLGEPVSVEYYDVTGRQIAPSAKGIAIKAERFANGHVRTSKVVIK